jgi:hypothetical protein
MVRPHTGSQKLWSCAFEFCLSSSTLDTWFVAANMTRLAGPVDVSIHLAD